MNKSFCSVILFALFLLQSTESDAQIPEINQNTLTNSANRMMMSDKKLTIGGYAQIDYNQPFGSNTIQNGKLDVHRMVLLFGYNFNSKLSFITEIEIEHVKEVFVEQAFINYAFNTYLNLRGGLILIPMGIINENHEPPTFNGVERPLIDKYIVPTTWREIGLGLTGTIPEISMKYQFYIINGFSSYNGESQLSGKYGLRKGRQKGAESIMRSPGLASRFEYFGLLGLNFGLSAYFGKTQSSLYKQIEKSETDEIARADSSVVGISMFGFDVRFQRRGVQIRGQIYYSSISNTKQYNYFTSIDGNPNDLGSSMYGYYLEIAYNVFYSSDKIKSELNPFVRFSNYDTQRTIAEGISKNELYNVNAITAGLGWKIIPNVAIKADVQLIKPKGNDSFNKIFNAGIGLWF